MFILIKEKCNRMSQARCAFSKTITKSLGLSNVLNIKIIEFSLSVNNEEKETKLPISDFVDFTLRF